MDVTVVFRDHKNWIVCSFLFPSIQKKLWTLWPKIYQKCWSISRHGCISVCRKRKLIGDGLSSLKVTTDLHFLTNTFCWFCKGLFTVTNLRKNNNEQMLNRQTIWMNVAVWGTQFYRPISENVQWRHKQEVGIIPAAISPICKKISMVANLHWAYV